MIKMFVDTWFYHAVAALGFGVMLSFALILVAFLVTVAVMFLNSKIQKFGSFMEIVEALEFASVKGFVFKPTNNEKEVIHELGAEEEAVSVQGFEDRPGDKF